MEHHHIFHVASLFQSGDDLAVFIGSRITAGCHYHAHRGLVFPLHHGSVQGSRSAGQHHLGQIAVQQGKHYLGFRIAETAVEFHYLHAVAFDHQSGIQAAGIGSSFFIQGGNDRFQNGLFRFDAQRFRHYRSRSIGAHAAGIGPFVPVVHPLVVLGCNHGHHDLAVGKGQKGRFFPIHKLFQHHPGAGFSEFMVGHHVVNGSHGFFFGHGNHHALAGRQPVRLHHNGRTLFFHKSLSRGNISAHLKGCRGDVIFLHQVFGKGFGSFQFRRRLVRPEDGQAAGTEHIGDTGYQRCFRPYHRQIDTVLFRKVRYLIQIT